MIDAAMSHALTSRAPTPKASRKYVGAGTTIHDARNVVMIEMASATQTDLIDRLTR
jgi:hypothetical protein